jgi:PLP dependent protein
MEPNIAKNLEKVLAGISQAEQGSGRPSGVVELIAVSKTHPPEVIQSAVEAGQLLFGENRVQEAKAKIPELPSIFEMIHGVDSVELLKDIQASAKNLGLYPKVLLQVNVAGESSKFGFSPDRLLSDVEAISRVERVEILGLMTIPPLSPRPEDSRKYFARLRELRDRLEKVFQFPLPQLSMGMSGDYWIAVEEGATLVRVGTAIFGERRAKR